MKSWKRVIPYLLLNVLVSALTTILVWLWVVRPQCTALLAELQPSPQPTLALTLLPNPTPLPTATVPPLGEPLVEITSVFGLGDVSTESITLTRIGSGDLWMTGWQLRDEDGHVFTFPEMIWKSGSIQIYTLAGRNTAAGLYWGLTETVWESGELVLLTDPQGNERAQLRLP